ncbi:hypothetical protein [Streptomyces iranensis]|uniref:Uncharacterized protein n=1 Tax=Streptomyces iranensis TaxID=576784 RepID=A0ABS4MKS2_9ACTN|nr:hypothetical protein [Streptomyces iranensis]MBP2060308.1 hypothetical protein [Streptomyces iranensis]
MIDRRTFGKAIGVGAAGTAAASLTGLSGPSSAAASSSSGPGTDRAATAPASHTGGGSFPALPQEAPGAFAQAVLDVDRF